MHTLLAPLASISNEEAEAFFDSVLLIISIPALLFGGAIAVFNAVVLVREARGRRAPSVAPILGGLILFVGATLHPNEAVSRWALLAFVVDPGCLIYLSLGISSELADRWRLRKAARILSLRHQSADSTIEFHLYPHGETLRVERGPKPEARVRMEVAEHEANQRILLRQGELLASRIVRAADGWDLEEADGEPRRLEVLFEAPESDRPRGG